MSQTRSLDRFGVAALTGFALLLAFNQVVIKVTNDGLQPVFFAALRSIGGAICIGLWMRVRGVDLAIRPGTWPAGLLIGGLFALEFLLLFLALDFTTVSRVAVLFYTMPVWLSLGAALLIPGERLTARAAAGLALACLGMALAVLGRDWGAARAAEDARGWLGDVLAIGAALSWAGIALVARGSRLREVPPETQLLWQLGVSAPLLLLAAPFFGPFLRAPTALHWAGLGFQIVVVVSAGFLLWLWLLSVYRAASVAAFSFLSPVFAVALGWALLGEWIGPEIWLALLLVCGGLILVTRPARVAPRG